MNTGKILISILAAVALLAGAISLWVFVGGTKNYQILGLPWEAVYFSLLAITVSATAAGTFAVARLVWRFNVNAPSQ